MGIVKAMRFRWPVWIIEKKTKGKLYVEVTVAHKSQHESTFNTSFIWVYVVFEMGVGLLFDRTSIVGLSMMIMVSFEFILSYTTSLAIHMQIILTLFD